jgi:hypothetical protein
VDTYGSAKLTPPYLQSFVSANGLSGQKKNWLVLEVPVVLALSLHPSSGQNSVQVVQTTLHYHLSLLLCASASRQSVSPSLAHCHQSHRLSASSGQQLAQVASLALAV